MSAYGENGFDRAGRTVCGECRAQLDNDSNCRCKPYKAVSMGSPEVCEAVSRELCARGDLHVKQGIRANLNPTVALHEVAEAARGKLGRDPIKFELLSIRTADGVKWCEWQVS